MSAGLVQQESLTQKWLRQNIQTYAYRDTVYSHADAVLNRYSTIRPKTDVYTYDDGRTQLLLCLHGLLPVTYRGASYNIPVAIWITRDYPRQPPIAYVVPTSDMLVRASKDIDVSGRCQIDYLRNWEKKSEGCNLVSLLEEMQDKFSREPPVYAKPQRPSASSSPHPVAAHTATQSPVDYTGKPPPPLPRTDTPSSRQFTSPAPVAEGNERPPLPAKPGSSAIASVPGIRSSNASASSMLRSRSQSPSGSTDNLALRPPPPLPAQTPVGSYEQASPVPPMYTPHGRSVSIDSVVLNRLDWPPGPPSQNDVVVNQGLRNPVQPTPLSRITSPTSTLPNSQALQQPVYPVPAAAGSHSYPSQQPVPPPFISPQPISYSQHTHFQAPPSVAQRAVCSAPISPPAPFIPPPDLLDADDFPASDLSGNLSSASVSAPPRPPNPELLRLHSQVHARLESELASLTQAMAIDAERLRANQSDLLAGEPAVRDEMARLEAVRDVCRGVSQRLSAVVTEGERNIAELRRKGDPEVDELVCSTTIVYNQLVNLVAEDNAIEDTIYHLHRALNTGRIDLERFLRTIRVLAEEQFLKRALIEKIQTGVPVGELSWVAPSGWT